jgi:hypothetical protein
MCSLFEGLSVLYLLESLDPVIAMTQFASAFQPLLIYIQAVLW